MKKLISILFILCLCVACNKKYVCKIDYKIDYPDTTLIKSYSFDCNSNGRYSVSENKDKLYIYYTGNDVIQHELDATTKEGKINVIRFRMFRKDIKEE